MLQANEVVTDYGGLGGSWLAWARGVPTSPRAQRTFQDAFHSTSRSLVATGHVQQIDI